MTEAIDTRGYAVFVVPGTDGWQVSCSCGYLVMGLPNQRLAQAMLDDHVARCHASDDDDA